MNTNADRGGVGSYLSRLVLPFVFLAAALVVWNVANRIGGVEQSTPVRQSTSSVDVPLTSIRRLPEFASTTSTEELLARALARLPESPGGLSCAVILLDGEPVLNIRDDLSLVPSYAQLLITSHAAMEVLGPSVRYETVLRSTQQPDDDGVLRGGLFVIGGGDPVLMTRDYVRNFQSALETHTALEDLASVLSDAGVTQIDGGVTGVDTRYDSQRSVPGWPESFGLTGLIGPLTALQVNDAFAERGGANSLVTVPSAAPTLMAVQRLVEELSTLGVITTGESRRLGTEEELPALVTLAAVQSAPLREILQQTLVTNDATAAELIVKELGLRFEGSGTTQAGGRAIQAVLQDLGVDVVVPFRGGSGLDPIGGTTCSQLVQTANAIGPQHPTLAALPRYDAPGVFGGRLAAIEMNADVRVVGGVQGDASGLVGRTVDSGAPLVSFVSIVNRSGGPTASDLAYQRALVEIVDDLRASITVESLTVDE